MNNTEFLIGDLVTITNPLHIFSTYSEWAVDNNLVLFQAEAELPKDINTIYRVIARNKHHKSYVGQLLYGIETWNTDKKSQFIILGTGLTLNPQQYGDITVKSATRTINYDDYPDTCKKCGKPAWNDKFFEYTKECTNPSCGLYKKE